MRRVQTSAQQKRLALATQWKAHMDTSYALDPWRIFFTDKKVFTIGTCAGGSQNYREWVHNATLRGDVPIELIRQEGGKWREGAAIMCYLGVSWWETTPPLQ